jgi:hypothetical protein
MPGFEVAEEPPSTLPGAGLDLRRSRRVGRFVESKFHSRLRQHLGGVPSMDCMPASSPSLRRIRKQFDVDRQLSAQAVNPQHHVFEDFSTLFAQ